MIKIINEIKIAFKKYTVKVLKIIIPFKVLIFLLHFYGSKKEHYVSYGEKNSDKVFYVIGGHSAGLYSIIHNVVGYLLYCEIKGFIPIVDYTNFETFYHEDGVKENIWECFFKQTTPYTLEEVYSSKHVIHSPTTFTNHYSLIFNHIVKNNKKVIGSINRIFKKYILFNEECAHFIEMKYNLIKDLKLLGVYIRGTDYINAKGHHIQPNINKIINRIDTYLDKYNFIEGIYLVTEDESILSMMIEKYGKTLFYLDKQRISNYSNGKLVTPNMNGVYENKKYLQGLEYLADIEILSKLEYFVSGINNGSAAVIEKNNFQFKDFKVFYEGFNGL